MNQEELIRKLVDYVLLNAYSVNSTGLYNGKAGLSLSLFGVARLLNDDYIEDQAYELLQEALLSTNKDISFENGLGGIGYVLHYLIINQFIETDFKELFDEKADKIRKSLEEIQEKSSKERITRNLSLVHFLHAMKSYYPEEEMNHWINLFLIESSQLLEDKFNKIATVASQESKIGALRLFETYVKLVGDYKSFSPAWNLLEKYENLYQANKLMSNFTIGYHLKNIAVRYNISHLMTVAIENMRRDTLSLYPDTMSLSQCIDFLYIFHKDQIELPMLMKHVEGEVLNMDDSTEHYEQYILKKMHNTGLPAGYQYGIGRLLLYWVYKNSPNALLPLFL